MTDEQWQRITSEWKETFGEDLNPALRSKCSSLAKEHSINLDTCSEDTLLNIVNQAKIGAYT